VDGGRGAHVPVLLDRVVALLGPALAGRPAVVVDATLGLGGHAEALLAGHPELTLVGLDRDLEALESSRRRLADYAGRIHLVHTVYDAMPAVLSRLGYPRVDGVLLDLGVSSMQLDELRRGFTYSVDAPLDMRMDATAGPTAADIVNSYPAERLAAVLREYGEERFAARIARAIVAERGRERFAGTARLAELVKDAVPAATRRTGGHPAKRTFQALRIEVNQELASLQRVLPAAIDALAVKGRIVVLSYHSLEDRAVKRAFAARARGTTPIDLPVELPGSAPTLRLLTNGAERPSERERTTNRRATSARLRAAERVREAA